MHCEICGKYSGQYKLCKECYNDSLEEDYDENESDCIICGDESNGYLFCKDCYYEYKDTVFSATINELGELEILNSENSSKCIMCQKEAYGYNFCTRCYQKYKNKSITIKIENCEKTEVLQENYTGKEYITEDGHRVKSKSEREIDNYFFKNGIKHAYEKEVKLKNKYGELISLHPDFCLFKGKEKIYIEFWGYDENNESYTKIKESKLKIYEEAGITLINLYEKSDAKDIEAALEFKLKNFEMGKINFIE